MRGALLALWVVAIGCAGPEPATEDAGVADEVALGPVDGRDLPATDLERVRVGDAAPDFSLVSLAGPTVTLSSYRGAQNVVLVFYRGHW
jgi:peroxiredoxin (alkyl hydroperoxide reductase subunit C)